MGVFPCKFRLLFSLLMFIACAMAVSAAGAGDLPDRSARRPLLNGTFIQLLEENSSWSRARWERLFDSFRDMGLTRVVIQWSVHDDTAFYATEANPQTQAPLDLILQLADERGMEVHVGLAAESRYWEAIKRPPAGQEEYLKRLRWKSEGVALEVSAVASRYRAFKGWYIPEEIDDLTWRQPKSRALLFRHLSELSASLRRISPGGTIMLSAFCKARMDPDTYREFWSDLLRESSVDILLFQDGAGAGELPRELLPVYLKAARSATDANNKELQVVVELFEMVSESPFKAIPAPLRRVRDQLRVAGEFATGGVNSFSVPDYMSLDGSAAARELYDSYLKYKGGGHAPQ